MTALLIVGSVMLACGLIVLSQSPEALAIVLTGGAILVPYNVLPHPERTLPIMTDTEALEIETRNGVPYVVTSPLPEHIVVSAELWATAEHYDPEVDGDTGLEPPAPLWLETVNHADEDKDNDGYVLHIDASNVTATYKVLTEDPDGDRLCRLQSWGER